MKNNHHDRKLNLADVLAPNAKRFLSDDVRSSDPMEQPTNSYPQNFLSLNNPFASTHMKINSKGTIEMQASQAQLIL